MSTADQQKPKTDSLTPAKPVTLHKGIVNVGSCLPKLGNDKPVIGNSYKGSIAGTVTFVLICSKLT